MACSRIQKNVAKVVTLALTLRNNKVPLEYKKMFIGSIIIPTVSYSSEIFGMNERRYFPLKKIIDQSLGMVLNSRSFYRNRAYEEFDLMPIQVKAAIGQARSLHK
jgi:hypothetical protein